MQYMIIAQCTMMISILLSGVMQAMERQEREAAYEIFSVYNQDKNCPYAFCEYDACLHAKGVEEILDEPRSHIVPSIGCGRGSSERGKSHHTCVFGDKCLNDLGESDKKSLLDSFELGDKDQQVYVAYDKRQKIVVGFARRAALGSISYITELAIRRHYRKCLLASAFVLEIAKQRDSSSQAGGTTRVVSIHCNEPCDGFFQRFSTKFNDPYCRSQWHDANNDSDRVMQCSVPRKSLSKLLGPRRLYEVCREPLRLRYPYLLQRRDTYGSRVQLGIAAGVVLLGCAWLCKSCPAWMHTTSRYVAAIGVLSVVDDAISQAYTLYNSPLVLGIGS